MNQDIPVYPNITKSVKIVKMKIEVIDMKLFESITLRVIFFNQEGIPMDVKILVLDQSNGYADWANDDSYIIEWVKKELKIGVYA